MWRAIVLNSGYYRCPSPFGPQFTHRIVSISRPIAGATAETAVRMGMRSSNVGNVLSSERSRAANRMVIEWLRARWIDPVTLSDGLRTVAIGAAIGIVLALAGGRLIAALLYGIEPHNPVVMTGAALALLAVAALATLGPAWRAARVDPVEALRSD